MIGADQALTEYIHTHLVPSFLRVATPTRLNLVKGLSQHLEQSYKLPKVVASERATEWQQQLLDRLDRVLCDWDDLGVPRPFTLSDAENVVISWQHPRYNEFCGHAGSGISKDFCLIYNIVKDSVAIPFLAICAVFLRVVGCEKILFTDASGDEGVDCLGVLTRGGLRSTNIVVQAKTSTTRISRNTVLAEYGKYLALPHSSKYTPYRAAIDVDKRVDGAAWLYLFVANNEFENSARQVAAKLGILLRSRRQIAHHIAETMSAQEFSDALKRLQSCTKADLSRNVALLI